VAQPYTLAAIRKTVEDDLGFGRVDVELDNRHFTRGLDAALKALARWFPMYGYQVLPVNPGGTKYKVTAANIIGVLSCTFFNGGPRFEEAPYYTRWVDRLLELGDMSDNQKVFQDQPEWHWQFENTGVDNAQECWLYTSFTRSSFVDTFARLPSHVCVQFAWYIEPSDNNLVGVPMLPMDLRQWVEDYTVAKCRTILGEIRNKFGGSPGSSDESLMPNDGSEQIQRGEDAMKRLTDDLNARRRQAPLLID